MTFLPKFSLPNEARAKDIETIRSETIELLKKESGQYSIYYENLLTGESFGIQENNVLTAASLNKLAIVGYLYSLAGKREINLEDKIVIQKEDIQDYGTGSLRYKKPGEPYTLKYLTQIALKQSDNTAAHVLTIRLGEDNVQEYARQMGLIATDMVNNETSARDIGRLLKIIYTKRVTTPSLTQELLGFMKDTDFEDRIPRLLPKNVSTFHKIGDAVTLVHDGAIIDDGKSPFVLVIMGNNLKDEERAKETIGKVAKFIYESRSDMN